ncbi:MAG: tRNA pseudouridine(55) synthase TruB [Verrucomicrobia bacterium]|nr:tRNA pseudouridine(55) synthase TruB [Verrucomicrobiota bacterium]
MVQGVLLVDKPSNITSFGIVSILRKRTGVKKIGHGGTLDPFATGLLVLLIGRDFTKRAGEFLEGDKEYRAHMHLGAATDTYDVDGKVVETSVVVPTLEEVTAVVNRFQGSIMQVPPMFSAKKIAGKRLYELARKGIEVERSPKAVQLRIQIISYQYPELELHVACSKGTYIRSLAHDIGKELGCFAHLSKLRRCRSGNFSLDDAISFEALKDPAQSITPYLRMQHE